MITQKRGSLSISIIMLLFLFFGCNLKETPLSNDKNTGDIALKINWKHNFTPQTQGERTSFDCNTDGVETIEISIYDKNNQEIGEKKPFQCSDHKGMIKDISHKTIHILLLAKNHKGDVVYRGMKRNVSITHGKTNKVAITATHFIPMLDSPLKKSCATTPILKWHKVKGASEYHILVSDNKAMENATSYIENNESHELLDTGEKHTIFWLVQAADTQGNISQKSEIFSFSTSKSLLKDITIGTASSDPGSFCEIDQILYFSPYTADSDKDLGRELWKTEGTILSTQLIKDINPGKESSNCTNFINYNGDLIFSATDGIHGNELWILKQGTEEPFMVKDIYPGSPDGSVSEIIQYKGHIYFSANNDYKMQGLWKSDGSELETKLLKNHINPRNFIVTTVQTLTSKEEVLFFEANDGMSGIELWRVDSSGNIATVIKDINPKGDGVNLFCGSATLNHTLYFTANDGDSGFELWKSDGTKDGTLLVKDINPTGDSMPSYFEVVDNTLFFKVYPNDLWKSNGTTEGTQLVMKFDNVEDGNKIGGFTSYKDKLFFSASDKNGGIELWVSDVTKNETYQFLDIHKGPGSSLPRGLGQINDIFYFAADNGINGTELWRSDGTENGTFMVKDIWPGKGSAYPDFLSEIGSTGSFVFSAKDGLHGNELWIKEGPNDLIRRLKDINTIKKDYPPKDLTIVNDTLFFAAQNLGERIELWKSDFTRRGTQKVESIDSQQCSHPQELTVLGDDLYFFAYDGRYSGLWKKKSKETHTTLVKSFETLTLPSFPHNLVAVNNRLFFIMDEANHGKELWVSNGTSSGTHSINIAPLEASSFPDSLTSLGNRLYFKTDEKKTNSRTLWSTDGFHKNTINHGSFSSPFSEYLVTLQNKQLYFFAKRGKIEGLWMHEINQVPQEAILIEDLKDCNFLNASGEQLFFTCNEILGKSLFVYDRAHQKKTKLLSSNESKHINKAGNFTMSKIGHYFILENYMPSISQYSYDIWLTDGTISGTRLIKEKVDRNGYIVNENIITVGKYLFFKGHHRGNGYELWMTDGTADGTRMIWEICEGTCDGNPQELTLYNNTLYFTAFDKEKGNEIRSICLDNYIQE